MRRFTVIFMNREYKIEADQLSQLSNSLHFYNVIGHINPQLITVASFRYGLNEPIGFIEHLNESVDSKV